MKRIFTLLTIAAFMLISFQGISQNMVTNGDLESWDNSSTPTGWDLYENISQESTVVHGGSYSAMQTSDASSKKFRQDIDGITGGQSYHIVYYFMDNDTMARTRIWSYWMQDGTYLDADADVLRPDEYSSNQSGWQVFDVTLTAPPNANQFRYEVRTYKENNNTGGHIYFDDFLFEADNTVLPEPTNYPTDFTATANGITIDLTWTDATGAQLPTGYLILGEMAATRSCTPPVDGTPVPDDLDWSDGSAAVNVAYGAEAYTFENLEANQEYHFCIYPYTNGGANIDYKTDGTPPEATATTADITVINSESFDDGLGTWTPYNVSGDQEWYQSSYGERTFAKMSGYDNGSHANEDWLISPGMDIANFQSVTFNFTTATKYDGPALQLFYSTDYDGSGNPNDFTWNEITDQAAWSDGNWNWVESGDVSLTDYLADGFYLAFKYTSTDEHSATWEVDDILVYGIKGVGISENSNQKVEFYPNPAIDMISVNTNNNGTLSVYSLTGKLMGQYPVMRGNNVIALEGYAKGMYLLQLHENNGALKTAKLIVK